MVSSNDARTTLLSQLKSEVTKCLLLSDEDKQYWLENVEKLPMALVGAVLKVVKEKNDLVEQYIRIALENDPNHIHLTELKTRIKQLKQTSLAIEEKAQTPNAEEELEQRLANL